MADVLHRVRAQLTRTASSLVSGHKLAVYGLLSLALAASAVMRAFKQYSNFYSAAVFLSRSAGSVLALANLGFFCTLIFGRIMQRIFFGPLRPSEVERLYDRIWYFLTESLLAFTIFRDEFDTPFILQFGALLFLKSFHWILGDRIEWMDQIPYPGPGWGFHVRTGALFAVLWTADLALLGVAVGQVLENGVGGVVLFGNEYAILAATLINYMLRYLIVTYDIRRAASRGGENAPPWQDKSMWIFYTELFTDFLKLLTYLLFFLVVLTFYGLPLNILRDVYLTLRSFLTRVRDLVRYRNATRNMDARYPDASAAELEQMGDRTCIICRDEMHAAGTEPHEPTPAAGTPGAQAGAAAAQVLVHDGPNMTPKKLPCGHVFHFQCLRSWLERQQSCPTCRRTVLDPTPTAAAGPAAQGQPPAPRPGAAPAPPGAPGAAAQPPAQAQAMLPQLLWQFAGLDPALGAGAVGGLWQAGWQAGQGVLGQQQGQQGQWQAVPGVQPAPAQQGQAQAGGPGPWTPPAGPTAHAPTPTATTPSTPAPGTPAGEPDQRQEEPPDPRRAAAEAALRRMGIRPAPAPAPALAQVDNVPPSPGPGSQPRPGPTPTPTPTRTINIPPPAAGPSTAGQPAQAAGLHRLPSTSIGPSSPGTAPAPGTATAPVLIPLFSPTAAAALPPLSYTTGPGGAGAGAGAGQFPFPPSAYPYPTPPHPSGSPYPPTPAAAARRTALDPSRLSLEEVDDTLQTLERLQGSLWESVEELVRVRSRLAGLVGADGDGRGWAGAGAGAGAAGLERPVVSEARGRRREEEEEPRRSYYS